MIVLEDEHQQHYYLYILECVNNTYYIGYTTDLHRRYEEHVKGSSKCKYTRSFPPKKIAAFWEVRESLSFVLSCEKKLKKLTRKDKQKLVTKPELIWEML